MLVLWQKLPKTGSRGAHMTHKLLQVTVYGRLSGKGSTTPTRGLDVIVRGSDRGSLVIMNS